MPNEVLDMVKTTASEGAKESNITPEIREKIVKMIKSLENGVKVAANEIKEQMGKVGKAIEDKIKTIVSNIKEKLEAFEEKIDPEFCEIILSGAVDILQKIAEKTFGLDMILSIIEHGMKLVQLRYDQKQARIREVIDGPSFA